MQQIQLTASASEISALKRTAFKAAGGGVCGGLNKVNERSLALSPDSSRKTSRSSVGVRPPSSSMRHRVNKNKLKQSSLQ